jgi:Protein of unknown function (DUF3365)
MVALFRRVQDLQGVFRRESNGRQSMDRLARTTFMLLLAGIVASCGAGEEEEVPAEVQEAVIAIGSSASDALLHTLMANLTAAMQENGAAGAIEFCSTSASGLTAEVVREVGVDMKRTSLRYRNPANAPDEQEIKALRHFQSVLSETGQLPGPLVLKAGRDEYRFYRPLTLAPPCLRCHGSAGEVDPTVQAILDERYPDDMATGYSAGDFRGVIRVSVPADRIGPT